MILSFIWTGCMILAILAACFSNALPALASAIPDGAGQAVTLALSMAGPLCLWSGLANVMEKSGIQAAIAKILSPLLRRLFPSAAADRDIAGSLCGNVTANLLGLGNAATPLGIRTVQQMQARSGAFAATDEMCRLIVLNTASIQLIPTTVAALRAGLGSAHPFDLLPAVWLTSVCSAGAGVLAAVVLGKLWRRD